MKALEEQPNPKPEDVARVSVEIRESLRERDKAESYEVVFAAMAMFVLLPLLVAMLEFGGLICFQVSPLLRLFGIVILDWAGGPAGRTKLLARWFLNWAALLLAMGLALLGLAGGVFASNGTVAGASFAVLAVGAWIVHAILRPWMTVADRLCGTRLAPV